MLKKARIVTLEGVLNEKIYDERVSRSGCFLGNTVLEQVANQAKLSNAVVGVAGAGGIGGAVALGLARLGVRHIKIADPDSFEISNINRQFGASVNTVGRNKALVVAEEVHKLAGDVTIEVFPEGIQKHTADAFVENCDLVLDQMDFYSIGERYALHRAYRKSEKCKGMLASSVVGWGANIYKFEKDGLTLEDFYGIPEDVQMTPELVDKLVKLQASYQPRFPSIPDIYGWMQDTGNVPILSIAPTASHYLILCRSTLMLCDLEGAPYSTPLPAMPKYYWFDGSTFDNGIYEFNGEWANPDEHQKHFKIA
ncbi:ThiF family adenylyltransferase [Pseudomonas abietaniphila]|jgi:molybdopterin/thiamine biosynthesis adenylyltransferase|uniref:ThiF family adenylyltransferase n=1 Tax=Pseudomonas abietaniphila TaxID=89065 RepID=UPI000782CB5B|nr:ThiF family adenylyltransferase [Pseudomonas abietaniphila]